MTEYVEFFEFRDMVEDIWDSDWFIESYSVIPTLPDGFLQTQALSWFIRQPKKLWHDEAARDMAHDFLYEVDKRYGFAWK